MVASSLIRRTPREALVAELGIEALVAEIKQPLARLKRRSRLDELLRPLGTSGLETEVSLLMILIGSDLRTMRMKFR